MPYGKTHGLLTSHEILDKLFHWNCEWFTRPNYAISELADTLYANLATLAEYKDKVFTKHAVDPLLNKARPIRTVLQRFNKKDSATAVEPDERDLANLMKFIEDDTLKSLKHLFAASGAMFSIAMHIMTLETLFSEPAEYAKRHRASPEVQSFKQNPSRESMVPYIASQTLSHTEIVLEEEQGGSIWDTVTQRSSTRQTHPTATFWDAVQETVDNDEAEYPYEDDDEEEPIPAPTCRRRPQRNILQDEEEPFNTPESSGEHALFITQQDPDLYHEPGTLSRTQKGKTPAARKRPSSTTNIWASFGLSAESSTSAGNSAPAAKKKATAPRPRGTKPTRGSTRGRGRGAWGKRGQPTGRHTYFA